MANWPNGPVASREEWTRARRLLTCGCCSGEVPAGDPILEIIGATWRKVRCVRCARKPVPESIPDAVSEPVVIGAKVAAMVDRILAVRDFKHAQGNDR